MTFLAPLFLFLGIGVASVAVALHFIVTRQPPSSPLPTARFVPEGSVRVTTVSSPTDLWLLLLRVLLALVIGAAFARPILIPKRRPVARVVLADVSRSVGSIDSVRSAARRLLSEGDVLVVFDSTVRVVEHGAADSAAELQRSERQGRLSAALIAAFRSAAHIRTAADSIELTIISPFRAAESDGATLEIRKLWPGRINLVQVAAASDSVVPAAGFLVRSAQSDPVRLAATVGRPVPMNTTVRIVRGAATAEDSTWVASGRYTLVRWPAEGAPPGWVTRPKVDTVDAVTAEQTALVVPLARQYRLDPTARPARVAARWVDGEPAAVEHVVGPGCIRDVAIPVPSKGDIMLRPSFGRLLETLGAPCAATSGGPGQAAKVLEVMAGTGPLVAAAMIRPPDTITTPLVPWLLALALVLALAELLVRRGKV